LVAQLRADIEHLVPHRLFDRHTVSVTPTKVAVKTLWVLARMHRSIG
jgi:hypothetical protein